MTHESTDTTPRTGKRAALRRRVRVLRDRLHESRRRTRAATGAAVLASAVALSLALWPDPQPEPILLGKGPAGVMTVSDRSQRTGPIAPPVVEEEAPPTNGDGTPIEGGEASYYGAELAGNPTASGEPFEPEGLTAAHRTLPLGTRLRVTNLQNEESVVVRVNDRGPFSGHRVIDLSTAAAREVGMLNSGTARVRLELLPTRG